MPFNDFNFTEISQSEQCLDTKFFLKQPLVKNIEQASFKLDEENPFVHYNIDFSNEEAQALRDFTLNISSRFGNEHYYDYFQANSTTETSKIINSFSNFLNHISSSKESTDVIVALIERIFLAASYNNNPDEITLLDFRIKASSNGYPIDSSWHTDSLYSGCMHRNFITLKGPTTLFYNDKLVREQILEYGDSSEYTYSEKLIDYSKVERATFGQGTVFIQGGKNAALHAGPKDRTDEDRLVVVIDKCNLIAVPEILQDKQESMMIAGYDFSWTTETI